MEIMRETPWSRIMGQNSVDKEFLENVGNGKPTGSVLKETFVVSVTISIKVRKWHSRIRILILSTRQNERNASRTRSPSGRMSRWTCKDYLKGTCTNSSCEKMAPSRMLVLQDQEWLSVWGKVLIRTSSGWWTADKKVSKEWWQKCSGYAEEGELASKRTCHRWMSRSTGETWEEEW